MNDYKTKSCAVYDNGLFPFIAEKLSESFGKVFYYSPWESAFPSSNQILVGQGIDGIIRVNSFWDIIDESDIFVFPDVYCGDVALHLAELGNPVWGSRHGEELETYRKQSKKHLQSLGIPIGKYEIVIGIFALRQYLKEHDNQYVKISLTRGDCETFHSENYKLIESRLDALETKLGAKKIITEFIVEDAIEPAIEVGTDTYCIDGKFPAGGLSGIEIKDQGYVCAYKNFNDMPEQLTSFNLKIAETLKKYNYRNFISSELRITEDLIPFAIDPCLRAGSPPSEIYTNMYENFADIIWNGAHGICIDPIVTKRFGVQAIIKSEWADENWQIIQYPEELKDNIKLKYNTRLNDDCYIIPQHSGHFEIGSVVALDDTIEGAIEKVREYADQVKGYGLTVCTDSIETGLEELKTLAGWGIDIL